MSKSIGNVISPADVLNSFNQEIPDALRYYMASAAGLGKDGNYSDEDFKEKVNAHLANSMGNLLNRTLSMLVKYFDGEIKEEFFLRSGTLQNDGGTLLDNAVKTVEEVKNYFDKYEIAEAAQEIVSLVDMTNKYVTDCAPWTLAKEEKWTECGQVLTAVLEVMCIVSVLIYPYCPNIAREMARQLSFDLDIRPDDLTTNNLKPGKLITQEDIKPVFLRMDSELADKSKSVK
jgi:methionyl-tRNA synthetase